MSLIKNGTPPKTPLRSSAADSASSSQDSTTALIAGLTAFRRAIAAFRTSVAVTSPVAMSFARPKPS